MLRTWLLVLSLANLVLWSALLGITAYRILRP